MIPPLADAEPTFDELFREHLHSLAPDELTLIDDSARHAGHAGTQNGRAHLHLRIVSAAFSGKTLLARHRLVFATLGDLMRCRIHALSIEALTPDEARQSMHRNSL